MDYNNLCTFDHCVSPPLHEDGGLCAFHSAQAIHGADLHLQHMGQVMWLMAVADGYEPDRDDRGCIRWPFKTSAGGYGAVNMRRADGVSALTPASRALCRLVNGEPPDDGQEWFAAHECGRGKQRCVTPEHLTWKTREENEADKVRHGTVLRGERNGYSKLDRGTVVEILTDPRPSLELVESFPQVSSRQIRRIRAGVSWGHVRDELIAAGVPVYRSKSGARFGDENVNRRKKLARVG